MERLEEFKQNNMTNEDWSRFNVSRYDGLIRSNRMRDSTCMLWIAVEAAAWEVVHMVVLGWYDQAVQATGWEVVHGRYEMIKLWK